ncbi:MAG: glycoside hydrolase family 3 N-terminal domain-containing protein, partial [Pseudomonadota bacterium]
VIAMGKAVALGLRQGGVAPVIKHAPGHGKGDADSHTDLPQVQASRETLEAEDFKPFLALKKEAMLMTAHVVFEALDQNHPGTTSPSIVSTLIREEWGYDGLILTDDINMQALSGTIEERSQAALAAGCDIICHCNGVREDMESVARSVGPLSEKAQARAFAARNVAKQKPSDFDTEAAKERLKALGLYEAQAV